MPIELAQPTHNKVTKQTAIPVAEEFFGSTTLSDLGAGFKIGWGETTQSLIRSIVEDRQLRKEAQEGLEDIIPEEDWEPGKSNYYVPMPWEEGMTKDMAMQLHEAYTTRVEFAKAGWTKWGGALGGAIADPINLIPFAWLTKGRLLYRAGKISAANMGIETVISPLVYKGHKARGEELTPGMLALNIGFAGLAGGILAGTFGGIGALLNVARGYSMPMQKVLGDILEEGRIYNKNFTLDADVQDLVGKGLIKFQRGIPEDSISGRTLDQLEPGQKYYIDKFGRYKTDRTKMREAHITVERNAAGHAIVSGDMALIAKLSKKIDGLLNDKKATIVSGKDTTVPMNKKEFADFISEEKRFIKDQYVDDVDEIFEFRGGDDDAIVLTIDPHTNKITGKQTIKYQRIKAKALEKYKNYTAAQQEDLGISIEGNKIRKTLGDKEWDVQINERYKSGILSEQTIIDSEKIRKQLFANDVEDAVDVRTLKKNEVTKHIEDIRKKDQKVNNVTKTDTKEEYEKQRSTKDLAQRHKDSIDETEAFEKGQSKEWHKAIELPNTAVGRILKQQGYSVARLKKLGFEINEKGDLVDMGEPRGVSEAQLTNIKEIRITIKEMDTAMKEQQGFLEVVGCLGKNALNTITTKFLG
jgi:hypothetical protein